MYNMVNVSEFIKRSFRKLPQDYRLGGAEKADSSSAEAWQLLVSDSSRKKLGPLQQLASILEPHRNETRGR